MPSLGSILVHHRGATQWTFTLMSTSLILLLGSILGLKRFGWYRALKNLVYMMSCSVVLCVTVFYWAIASYDLRMIDGLGRTSVTPLEAVLHSAPCIIMILTMLAGAREHVSLRVSLASVWFFEFAYLAYIHLAYHYHTATKWWPYGFMNNLTTTTWIVVAIGTAVALGIVTVAIHKPKPVVVKKEQ